MSIVQNKSLLPDKWGDVADVVIIGYGGAGASAAIASHDAGAKVLVLEKAPFGGGNTWLAGSGFVIPDDVDKAIEYYRRLTAGTVDEELIRALAERNYEIPQWLEKLGAQPRYAKTKSHAGGAREKGWVLYDTLPESDSFMTSLGLPRTQEDEIGSMVGERLWHILDNQVKKREIKILYETPAEELVQNPLTREICGVKATNSAKKEIYVKAKKGVILTCGGFANNREMVAEFLLYAWGVPFYQSGHPYNTGDGIYMATKAGAKLWHMTSAEYINFGPKALADEIGASIRLWPRSMAKGSACIYINKYGKRFMDEALFLCHSREYHTNSVMRFDAERGEFPNIPFFMVFDETYRKKGPIARRSPPGRMRRLLAKEGYQPWSDDNSIEIERGWIERANTIKQLAEKIRVPPEALEETVSKYNETCSRREDAEFGRPKEWLIPIESPPFYATELCEILLNTQGGPKHNAKAQVLGKDDKPIPRLYAAGELGSVFGPLYEPGSNVPEALSFGRIAGEQAAALTPWE